MMQNLLLLFKYIIIIIDPFVTCMKKQSISTPVCIYRLCIQDVQKSIYSEEIEAGEPISTSLSLHSSTSIGFPC